MEQSKRAHKKIGQKKTILIMKRSKNGKFNKKSRAVSYWDTFNYSRLFFMVGVVIGLVILLVTLTR